MIEGFAREMPEDVIADAIAFAHQQCQTVIDAIEELREKAGLGPKELPAGRPRPNPLVDELYKKYGEEFRRRYLTEGKLARYAALDEFKEQIKKDYAPPEGQEPKYTPEQVSAALSRPARADRSRRSP